MVDLMQSSNYYDLAAESRIGNTEETISTQDLFLSLADSCARDGQIHSAFNAYIKAFKCDHVKHDQLNNLVTILVDKMGQPREVRTNVTSKLVCDLCKLIWTDPVTICCGQTFCRKCVEKTLPCTKCKIMHDPTEISNLRTNVMLSSLVEKYLIREMNGTKLKEEGNLLFSNQQYQTAIQVYKKAFELAPSDHLIPSNISFALVSLERYEDALQYAELVINIRPDLALGYYKKATALSGLNLYEQAALAYLQCLSLDPSITSARTILMKTLHRVFSNHKADTTNESLREFCESVMRLALSAGTPFQPHLLGTNCEPLQNVNATLLKTLIQGASGGGVDLQLLTQQQQAMEHVVSIEPIPSHDQLKTPSCSLPLSEIHVGQGSIQVSSSECAADVSEISSCPDMGQSELTTSPVLNTISEERIAPRNLTTLVSERFEKEDFECSLCYRLMYKPVTTPCGHCYCMQCLDRSLDHQSSCPLCKSSLVEYLAERREVITTAIEFIIQTHFPEEFEERTKIYDEELALLSRVDADQIEIPIFVCTLGYPGIPCPLHVFEPRYRLMIRQCMESGTRQFGMCIPLSTDDNDFSDVGTMLEVHNVQYFPDGRSVVNTVGGRRFKVISKGHRDGYNTAKIEFIKDKIIPEGPELEELKKLHSDVYIEARTWLGSLLEGPQARIEQHFGEFPALEPNHLTLEQGPMWLWWITSVMPLGTRAQLTLLTMTSLYDRLTTLHRVLVYVKRHPPR